jgi:hypothetical protein
MTQANTQALALTRMEVAEAVGPAFGMGFVDREEIVATARRAGARYEVVEALSQLPARKFNDLRQLWAELPDMPVK